MKGRKAKKASSSAVGSVIRGQADLAKFVGRHQGTVSKLLKRDDCPIRARGPWTAAEAQIFKSWCNTLQEDRAAIYREGSASGGDASAGDAPTIGPAQARAVDLKLKMERMKKVKLEREILEKLYVARDEVERGLAQRIHYFRSSLEDLPNNVAAQCEGLKAPQIAALIRSHIQNILDQYARRPFPGLDSASA